MIASSISQDDCFIYGNVNRRLGNETHGQIRYFRDGDAMDQTSPSPTRARAQLRGNDLVSAIAGAGQRVVYIDDDQRPLAAVLPIDLWKMIAAIPYYRAITESYAGNEPSEGT